jgi:hypothetical protein
MKNPNAEDLKKTCKALFFAFSVSVVFNIYALQKSSEKMSEVNILVDSLVTENNILKREINSCQK